MAVNQQDWHTLAAKIRANAAQQQMAMDEAAIFAYAAMRGDAVLNLVQHNGVWMLPEDVRRNK